MIISFLNINIINHTLQMNNRQIVKHVYKHTANIEHRYVTQTWKNYYWQFLQYVSKLKQNMLYDDSSEEDTSEKDTSEEGTLKENISEENSILEDDTSEDISIDTLEYIIMSKQVGILKNNISYFKHVPKFLYSFNFNINTKHELHKFNSLNYINSHSYLLQHFNFKLFKTCAKNHTFNYVIDKILRQSKNVMFENLKYLYLVMQINHNKFELYFKDFMFYQRNLKLNAIKYMYEDIGMQIINIEPFNFTYYDYFKILKYLIEKQNIFNTKSDKIKIYDTSHIKARIKTLCYLFDTNQLKIENFQFNKEYQYGENKTKTWRCGSGISKDKKHLQLIKYFIENEIITIDMFIDTFKRHSYQLGYIYKSKNFREYMKLHGYYVTKYEDKENIIHTLHRISDITNK